MPVLQIKRSDEYANRFRNIKIFLDGKQLGSIKNAATESFEIPEGRHLLQAKIDWCSSNTITLVIKGGETKIFSMTSFAKKNPLGSMAVLYYISFAANKFLHLDEVH